MKTYRTGFLLALVANILLVAVVAGLWSHYHAPRVTDSEQPKHEGTMQGASANSSRTASAPTETP